MSQGSTDLPADAQPEIAGTQVHVSGGHTLPTQAAMRAGFEAYVARINAGDRDGVVALFAPDATIEDPVGAPLKRGEDIAAWFADTVAFGTRIRPVAPIRGSHGREAVLTFEVDFTPPGAARMRIRSVDVCTFDDDGRITSLRGFWGPDDIVPLDGEAPAGA